MNITHESLPEGSYLLRAFRDSGAFGVSDIDLVVVLKDLGAGVCELSAAKGRLSDEINLKIAEKAHELGFRIIQFSALRGKKVTRWAEYVNSDEQFDYYTVDLQKIMNKAGSLLDA